MSLIRTWITSRLKPSSSTSSFVSHFQSTATRGAFARNHLTGKDYWERKLRLMERADEKEQKIREERQAAKGPSKNAYKKNPLRGHPRDEEDVRISKTLSWVLRHGAKAAGLCMRPDGYARVHDLLALPKLRSVDFQTLERIVQHDAKERYHLLFEPSMGSDDSEGLWWIRANQGHSMKEVDLQLSEITDAGQVPMAVHGTTRAAWSKIEKEGLSPMKRAHIHLAQHYSHIKGVSAVPGIRSSSQVLIFIDLDHALRAGIKFHLSSNGVILTKGDESGFLRPEFFKRVTDVQDNVLPGWSGVRTTRSRRGSGSRRSKSPTSRQGEAESIVEPTGSNVGPGMAETTEVLSSIHLKEST